MKYNELVKALRCVSRYKNFTKDCNSQNPNEPCRYCHHWICEDDRIFGDAAAAIEALQAQLPKRGQYVHGRELSREYIGDCLVSIDYEDWRCSVCGIVFKQWSIPKYNYCPNCGAKMEVQV